MFKSLMPKDNYLFDQFDRMCVHVVEGAKILIQMLESGNDYNESAKKLKAIEHEADIVVHEIVSYLHKTFITPIDREDVFKLAKTIDDILDLTEGAASRIKLYQPKGVPEGAKALGRVLLEGSKLVKEMIGLLHDMKRSEEIIKHKNEIKRLENEADVIRRSILAELFRCETDVFELIKWKDILEYMEKGTDRCDAVGNITEGIVIENT